MSRWLAGRGSREPAAARPPNGSAGRRGPRLRRAKRSDWRFLGGVACLLLGALLPVSGRLQLWDWTFSDAQMRAVAHFREPTRPADVVLVTLDERTLASMAEPLALIHRQLGSALEALAGAGVRAVAVDLVLPERSFDRIAPGYDERLLRGILAVRRVAPIVLAQTVDEEGRPRPVYPAFMAAAGERGLGFALLPVDDDGVVRRFDEHLGADGAAVPTLVGVLARHLGVEPRQGAIDFSRRVHWTAISLQQLLSWAEPGANGRVSDAFRDKIVLLGSSLNLVDLHRVPVDGSGRAGEVSGLLIHAQVLQGLRSDTLLRPVPGGWVALLGALLALGWASSATARSAATTAAALAIATVATSTALLVQGWALPTAGLLVAAVVPALARWTGERLAELEQRRRLRRVFAGYVSPGVMAELEAGRLDDLDSSRRFIGVLFVDLRGFTARAEHDTPERITATLNLMFTHATHVIHRHGGTVKEFMGDGVMAFFGAPMALDDPGQAAIEAACAIHEGMPQVNASMTGQGLAPLTIGMGVASGIAVVGNIGAADRHTYGAVGDCVNLASRLEGLSKELGYPLIVSADTVRDIASRPGFVALGLRAVKGHSPVNVFGWAPPAAS